MAQLVITVIIIGGVFAAALYFFGVKRALRTRRESFPYARREPFLSVAERSFYGVLCANLPDGQVALVKVRLGDLIKVRKGLSRREFWRYFNPLVKKHVDFVVCDKDTMEPLYCIELDDQSHRKRDRALRDEFVDLAFQAAGLELRRVPCKSAYTAEDVAKTRKNLVRTQIAGNLAN